MTMVVDATELRDRMVKARARLFALRDTYVKQTAEWRRLEAKAHGVELCIGYLDEMMSTGTGITEDNTLTVDY